VKNWERIDEKNFTFRIESHDYYAEVEVFKIAAWFGPTDRLEYERKGAKSSDDTTDDLDNSQRCISGSIKWDGCSNLRIFPDENFVHFCGKSAAVEFGELFGRLYELVKERISVDEGCYE
jgi:hypothetical protein